MADLLVGWKPEEVIGLVSVVGGLLTVIVWVIAHYWRSVRLAEIESGLKRDFLHRGLSVEEIERLLRSPAEPAKPAKPDNERELDANLAALLVGYEVSAPTMEHVI